MEGRRPAAHQVAPLEEHTAGRRPAHQVAPQEEHTAVRRPAHQNPGRQSSPNRTFSQTNWADIVAGHQHKVSLTVSELKRLKSLEDENRRLKQIVAHQALDNWALKELLSKNF